MRWNNSQVNEEIYSEIRGLESRINEIIQKEKITTPHQAELDEKIGRLTLYEELMDNTALQSKFTFFAALKGRLADPWYRHGEETLIADPRVYDTAKARESYLKECAALLQKFDASIK
jgi:hypothetical protein